MGGKARQGKVSPGAPTLRIKTLAAHVSRAEVELAARNHPRLTRGDVADVGRQRGDAERGGAERDIVGRGVPCGKGGDVVDEGWEGGVEGVVGEEGRGGIVEAWEIGGGEVLRSGERDEDGEEGEYLCFEHCGDRISVH